MTKKILKYLSLLFLFFVLILLIIVMTTPGMHLAIRILERYKPIHIEKCQGTLFSGVTIDRVTYRTKQTKITAENVVIDWHFVNLFNPSIVVDQFYSKKVNVEFLENPNLGIVHFEIFAKGQWLKEDQRLLLNMKNISGVINKHNVGGALSVNYENGKMSILPSQLTIENAKLSLQGAIEQSYHINYDIILPDMSLLHPSWRGALVSKGLIAGTKNNPQLFGQINANHIVVDQFKISKLNGNITTKMSNNISTIYTTINAYNAMFESQPFEQLTLNTQTQLLNTFWHTILNLKIDDSNGMHGEMDLPNTIQNITTHPVHGHFVFAFLNLAKFLPKTEVNILSAKLNGAIDINGVLLKPKFDINTTLSEGAIDINHYGTKIRHIYLTGHFHSNEPFLFDGTFLSGDGTGHVDGQFNFDHFSPLFKAHLFGEQLLIINLRDYRFIGNPDIQYHYETGHNHIQGVVIVPYSKIMPTDYSSITTLPNDMEYDDQLAMKNKATFINYSMNLKLIFKDHNHLDYQNLTGNVQGAITINKEIDGLPLATGELNIENGGYRAYGKHLSIESGKLIYTGNLLMNPGLNIRAIRKVKKVMTNEGIFNKEPPLNNNYVDLDTIKVGVLVKGLISKPQFILFSEPAELSQEDILSYLVFDRPQSQINSASSFALLNNLATGSNNKGFNVGTVTKKIKKFFKLSELSIGSIEYFNTDTNSADNVPALNIGKYLGKRLSIHYSVGLFNPITVFNARYQINKRLSLQSESSLTDTGADLIYEFEK